MNEEKTKKPQWKPTWKECILYSILGILFVGQIILCFLFYNWAGLDVLLYLGWAILVVGFGIGWMAHIAFYRRGESPEGESWLQTTVVVDSGIYAVVRHPMYLIGILYVLTLILISQHWLSVIFGFPIIVFYYLSMRDEEQSCIEKFGDDYKHYMQKVPRTNLLVGVIRLIQRRRIG